MQPQRRPEFALYFNAKIACQKKNINYSKAVKESVQYDKW